MTRARFNIALALVLAFAAAVPAGFVWGSHARAQNVGVRTVGVSWQNAVPRVSFSARDLVTAEVRRKLESGLWQTIVMRTYAYAQAGGNPIAVTPRSCRVVYDLWEEVFRVQVQTSSGDRTERVTNIDGVVERCLVANAVPIGSPGDYTAHRGSSVYFAVLVELNPLSPDTVQRIRRWLARPGGGRLESEAFFGSFVSLFVNRRIGSAERSVGFRSQLVSVP